MRAPAASARAAICSAAHTAAPADMPARIPSRVASSRATEIASSNATVTTSSITDRSSTSGTKFGPMPWMRCPPARPSLITGESAGSTSTTFTSGLRSLSTWPTPVMVPPVPDPATNQSTRPSVSRQISSAVVRRWTAAFASLSNCRARTAPGVSATMRFAASTASVMPLYGSVSTSSAPYAFSSVRRSFDMDAGIVSTTR